MRRVLADVDDRLRLPQWNGAVHLGFEGALAVILVPVLGAVASIGPQVAALVLLASVPLLVTLHRHALRQRYRSRFFVAWSGMSFAYGNLVFTLRCGERVPFAAWLACAVLHLTAAVCASTARRAMLPPKERPPAPDDSGDEGASVPLRLEESVQADMMATSDSAGGEGNGGSRSTQKGEGVVRCALCGQRVPGYDHHCIWLDVCIGAPNMGPFVRGLLALATATALQAYLVGSLALQNRQHDGQVRWDVECVGAVYAGLISVAVCALLASICTNVSRGVTAREARRLRRIGSPLPPMQCQLLTRDCRSLLWP